MKTIHKFRLEPGKEPTTLSLHDGYRVVRCEYMVPDKSVYIWVEQPLRVGAETREHHFRVAFSGEPVPDSFEYRGTALDTFGPEAYHVFEVPDVEHSLEAGRAGNHDYAGEGWHHSVAS